METTGRTVNDKIRQCGVVTLVDLEGNKLWFYPRGRLPHDIVTYLNLQDGHAARLLRDFVVTLGRLG
jgi:hypothetical protein